MNDHAILANVNYVEAFKRRLPLGLLVAGLLLLATIALTLGLPSVYKSRAVILIEQQEVPQDLVRSVVTSYADQRIQTISQRVLTTNNLNSIIQKYNLYPEDRERYPLEVVLKKMRDDINVETISADIVDPRTGAPRPATIAFELSYLNKSADLAQKVANEIVTLFLNENLKERTETADQTLVFLNAESERLGKEIAMLDAKLAAFKEKNGNALPELQQVNMELLHTTQRELSEIDSRIQAAEEQRVFAQAELAQQKPISPVMTETGERVLGPADRLKVLQSQYTTLTSRYGAGHPDVISTKKEMDQLQAQIGTGGGSSELALKRQDLQAELDADLQKYSNDHPDVKRLKREIGALDQQIAAAGKQGDPAPVPSSREVPDNPLYIQMKARLQAAEADLHSLTAQRADLKARLADLEARLSGSPKVEKEYRELTRDYENAQAKYRETLAKKQEAELAKNLENQQKGERFELIEPPLLPEKPAKPNRLALGLLGTLLSIVGSIGSGTLAETLDTRVYGRSGVTRVLGVPPLAVIPLIENEEMRRRRRTRRVLLVGGILAAIAIALALIHFMISPLDVLFYRAWRVYGI